ncbi:hypothetical protein B9G55_14415 [Saccharibacillus sp. O16]|nr:hypothetical protein B9G55_14415 [Saccharibacillus sp. O16]
MSVYTSIRQLIEELDRSIFESAAPPEPRYAVLTMRELMPEIWRYGKNMNPKDWDRLQPYIESDEEILISEEAYRDARSSWERIKNQRHEKKGVGAFYTGLAHVWEDLLVYSRSWSECCDRCQGTLRYYVLADDKAASKTLVTSCDICMGLFDASSGELIMAYSHSSIRRAVKTDLEPL